VSARNRIGSTQRGSPTDPGLKVCSFGFRRLQRGTSRRKPPYEFLYTKASMRLKKKLALSACMILAACGPPPTGTEQTLTIKPDGPTAGMKHAEGPPLYSLDSVNGVTNPLTHGSIAVSWLDNISASGWAVDKDNQSEAGGVDLGIDGKPYRAEYNIERPDVANYFKVPAYSKSGYRISIPARAFGKGVHHIAVRAISKGGSHIS